LDFLPEDALDVFFGGDKVAGIPLLAAV